VPAAAPPSPVHTTTSSKVLPRFLSAVGQQPAPVLLDLGAVVGTNIGFFGDRLACKIYVEDLFTEVERRARQRDRETLGASLAARLAQPPGSVNGILCWDLFDFLDRAGGQVLAARLVELLRPGGALHGFFGTTPIELTHYTRYVVEDEQTMSHRTYPATPVRRNVLLTRDIGKMFAGLTVAESVLLKTSTRETLFRKA
jgi:hypothetical protein